MLALICVYKAKEFEVLHKYTKKRPIDLGFGKSGFGYKK